MDVAGHGYNLFAMEKFIQDTAKFTGLHLNARQVRSFQLYEKTSLQKRLDRISPNYTLWKRPKN